MKIEETLQLAAEAAGVGTWQLLFLRMHAASTPLTCTR